MKEPIGMPQRNKNQEINNVNLVEFVEVINLKDGILIIFNGDAGVIELRIEGDGWKNTAYRMALNLQDTGFSMINAKDEFGEDIIFTICCRAAMN